MFQELCNTSNKHTKLLQDSLHSDGTKKNFYSRKFIKWLKKSLVPWITTAVRLIKWQTDRQLDWAASYLHNSRSVGKADCMSCCLILICHHPWWKVVTLALKRSNTQHCVSGTSTLRTVWQAQISKSMATVSAVLILSTHGGRKLKLCGNFNNLMKVCHLKYLKHLYNDWDTDRRSETNRESDTLHNII